MADDGFGSADMHEKEVVRLWRAWRTVHEMVADRVRTIRLFPGASARDEPQLAQLPRRPRRPFEGEICC
jgi:DNA-directed RNA polymerase I, II, and III subunit RPABC1